MSDPVLLRITGEVDRPLALTLQQLADIPANGQVSDVSRIDARRRGDAVHLRVLLQLAQVRPTARYLGLHSSQDDFHASIPLDAVRDQGLLIYRAAGKPLTVAAGGPLRFFIPDHAACHTAEVDECANVKFVDWIELTAARGQDNRPSDDEQHARLHEQQA